MSRILELVSLKPAPAVTPDFAEEGMLSPQLPPAATPNSDEEERHLSLRYASLTGPANMETKLDPPQLLPRHFKTLMNWCCDVLPGIEAAFSVRGLFCLFCGDDSGELGQDQESAEWYLRGRHLVDEHRYGECNLLVSYASKERFAQHIQEFHQCSLDYNSDISRVLLDKCRRFGQETGFHRGQESKDQNLTDDFHSIRSRRWEALFSNTRTVKAIHNHPEGANVLWSSDPVQLVQPVQQSWEVDLYTALSEENCIVDGLMVASIFHPWSSFNHYGDDKRKQCYSLGDGIKVSRYEFDARCDSLFKATRLLRAHDTNKKPGLDVLKHLGQSSANNVLPRRPVDSMEATSARNRINMWLQEFLQKSLTHRIIMFHEMKKLGLAFPDLYTWLEMVLEFWDLDEVATTADEPDNSSDGALDSRGSPEIRTSHMNAGLLGLSCRRMLNHALPASSHDIDQIFK